MIINRNIKEKIIGNIVWRQYLKGGIATLLNKTVKPVVGLLTIALLTRALSDDLFGALQYLKSWMFVLIPLLALGQERTLLYKIAGLPDVKYSLKNLYGKGLFSKVLVIQIITFSGISGVLIILMYSTNLFNTTDEILFWIIPIMILLFFSSLNYNTNIWFQSNQKVFYPQLLNLITPLLTLLFIFLAYYLLNSKPIFIGIGLACAPIITFLSLLLYYKIHTIYNTPNTLSKEEFKYGAKVVGTKTVDVLNQRMDILMLGMIVGTTPTGPYSVAISISILSNLGNEILNPVFTPRLRKSISLGKHLKAKKEIDYSRSISFLIGLFFLMVLFLLKELLLELLGIKATKEIVNVLLVLTIAHVIKHAFGPVGRFLSLSGYSGTTLVFSIFSLLSAFFANMILIPQLNMLGAAIGTLIALSLVNAIMLVYINHRWNFKLSNNRELFLVALVISGLVLYLINIVTGIIFIIILSLVILVEITIIRKYLIG